jgi:guanosine-3',5'-bis(diphosphate) 3'-pyrophosphohydrolase
MISDATLIEKIKSYDPNVNVERLQLACDFSKDAHGTQLRASGSPYFMHPMEVAHILAEMRMDEDSIITALLHDTVEDTHVTSEEIERIFGAEVATLVAGVTKLAKIEYQTEHVRQAENFRKLLVAMSEDIRVLLVKLADRLHNMRTLHYVKSPEKRTRIAHETMEIYAPLAERIGMQQFKNELQDLAFSELHPEARESIKSRLEYLREQGEAIVAQILSTLTQTLYESGLEGKIKITGREKTPYSIWRKMERKNISFEQLSDIMAFRILTDTVETCYHTLGSIHTHYQMVPNSFKDFISTPKENGYRSLHTVVMGPEQRFIEIQIRTQHMHDIAELGVAAHWSYKQKREYNTDGKQYKWMRELLYILEHASDPEEFLENTKLEIYYDQVFCFSPKGKLIALPKGATAVDFAYEVHSDVGNHCAGVKINGRIMPLRTQLSNGDQVEIITSETQVPSPAWENFVVTGKAKSEVRRFVRAQKREEYIKLGRSLIERRMHEEGLLLKKDLIKAALKLLNKKHINDIYAVCGEGMISADEALRAFFPNKKFRKKRRNPFALLGFNVDRNRENNALAIKGLKPGLAVYFAECCHPIPGDTIVGVVTTGKGMTIHTSDCETLTNFSSTPERLVDVSWGNNSTEFGFISRMRVILSNEAGSLATLANVIAKHKSNISNLKIVDRSSEFFEMVVDVAVKGDSQLDNIIRSLRTKKCVHSAKRSKR